MKRDRFENWLRNIYETEEEEISCTECFDQVSRFVELEASGENAVAKLLQVKQHLNQCQACRDEYETLRELRRLEDEGGTPSLDDLQDLIH
jgi:DNA-binding SARP family transcriptional activator